MKTKKYLCIASVFAVGFWLIRTNINITTTHLKIKSDKIPAEFNKFKIAQVSDLHNHPWGKRLIDKIKVEEPDIIAITGDLITSSKPDFSFAVEFIKEANEIAPIYYVTGNHESRFENYSLLEEELRKLKVNMMDNESVFLEKGASKIQILGIQDPSFIEPLNAGNIQAAIVYSKLNEILDKDYFNITLSHRPEQFEQYVNLGADLVLTGHAHGGQVRVPFVGGLIAPNQGFLPKYTEGLYKKKDTAMVVSRGLGRSIIPVRVNNNPELVVITLENTAK